MKFCLPDPLSTRPQNFSTTHPVLTHPPWMAVAGEGSRSKDKADEAKPGEFHALPHGSLPGLFLCHEFLSEEEEKSILEFLDGDEGCDYRWKPGHFNGPAYRKIWGVRTDLKKRIFLPAERPLPPILVNLGARMRGLLPVLRSFHPNEANGEFATEFACVTRSE